MTSPRPLPRWLSSCRHVVEIVVGDAALKASYDGVFHAREIGSSLTACGEPAFFWTNLYDRPYQPGAMDSCTRCDEVLRSSRS